MVSSGPRNLNVSSLLPGEWSKWLPFVVIICSLIAGLLESNQQLICFCLFVAICAEECRLVRDRQNQWHTECTANVWLLQACGRQCMQMLIPDIDMNALIFREALGCLQLCDCPVTTHGLYISPVSTLGCKQMSHLRQFWLSRSKHKWHSHLHR